MIDELPAKPWINEAAICNLNRADQPGSHWVCYIKSGDETRYFDSFGAVSPPPEIVRYLNVKNFYYNTLSHQSYDQRNYGQLRVRFLLGKLQSNNTHRLI